MSAIDHKAEAEQLIAKVGSATDDLIALGDTLSVGSVDLFNANAGRDIARAQVHATLYAAEQTAELVKQQRIANLIEVGRDRDQQLSRELNDPNFHVLDGSTLTVSAPTDLLEASNAVKSLIREGLGIS